ncbi:MAG: hypothetical protein JNJ41_14920 [Bacteroidia bacterium]|nr:hypothetical protein [Bacteroidia bacterium]
MKILFLLVILISYSTNNFAQNDTLVVNSNTYLMLKQTIKNDFGSKDTVVRMYRIENNVRKFLLTHYSYRYETDCNNEFKDIGTIKFKGSFAIFETKFLQKGSDPIPKKQKQVYKFQENGKLTLLSDQVYFNGKWLNSKDFLKIP